MCISLQDDESPMAQNVALQALTDLVLMHNTLLQEGEEGIEIEVDTVESERRKHLATIVCSALILNCLKEGLYPSWDAQNRNSVRLAEKLGYVFDHEYAVYEVSSEARTH